MADSSYSDKFKDPRWQQRRLQILERDNFTCLDCGDRTSTLHVHHLYYIKGRDPWDYPGWSMVTKCSVCHEETHSSPGSLELWEVAIQKILANHGRQHELLDLATAIEMARPHGLNAGVLLQSILKETNSPA